jgi:hypothetical protein
MEQKQKQLWMTVGVAAVVAIVSSFLTMAVMGPIAFSPDKDEDRRRYVSANDCAADEVCETNEILTRAVFMRNGVGQLVGVMSSTGLQVGNHLSISSFDNRSIWFSTNNERRMEISPEGYVGIGIEPTGNQHLQTPEVAAQQFSVFDNDASQVLGQISSLGHVFTIRVFDRELKFQRGSTDLGKFDLEGNLIVNNLAGNGEAYACIGENGQLFRSDRPCR